MNLCLPVLLAATAGVLVPAAETTPVWSPATWQDEPALASSARGLKAVVSLVRGRLVYFGPASPEENLLFATARRDDPAGWGGHRLWLGPQAAWARIWPPPAAWESSAPGAHLVKDGQLRLALPPAGDGWPRLTRTYHWRGATLICGAELNGGTKAAQVIQIIQVPPGTVIEAEARAEVAAPAGYVLLPAGGTPQLLTEFPPPRQVTRADDQVQLRYNAVILKPGFRPQTLLGRDGSREIRVGRGAQSGTAVATPDAGFLTQVYLGGHEPFIELEQLSPVFAPGGATRFEITLETN